MTDPKQPLRVFLCHSSADKPAVRKLYKQLKADGVDAWLDAENLIPGQNWQVEIPNAIGNSDVVIVFLSEKSVNKEGFVQKEIKFALDIADEKPEGTIFIIPARLEDCKTPNRLSMYHWVDLFEENGYEYMMRALRMRAENIGATLQIKQTSTNKYLPILSWTLSGVILLIALFNWLPGIIQGPELPTITPTFTFTPPATKTPLPTFTFTLSPTSTKIPSETPVPLLAPIAGTWIGVDKGTVGGNPVPDRDVEMTIQADCNLGDKCGSRTVQVDDSFCGGNLFLVDVQENTFTFDTVQLEESASFCGDGGTIIIRSMSDGTISSESDGYNSSGSRVIKIGTFSHP